MTLIVDTDIAKSSGAGSALALTCAELLNAIYTSSSLGVYMCPRMTGEWFCHMSAISRHWYNSMKADGRIFTASVPRFSELQEAIDSLESGHNHKAIMLKDLHLVEAARCTDKRIVSGDGRARNAFRGILGQVPELHEFLWAHIDENDCGKVALAWVKSDAPHNESLRLSYETH